MNDDRDVFVVINTWPSLVAPVIVFCLQVGDVENQPIYGRDFISRNSGVSMDSSHGFLALGGLFFGWWFTSKPAPQPEVRSEPSACHCVCSVKPEPCSSGADWQLLLGLGLLILVLAANLFLAFKVTIKQSDSGDREYSVSFKGRSGKGVFGASKGLQILDR